MTPHLKNIHCAFLLFMAFFISMPSSAQQHDDPKIQELVQKEVERLIKEEGFLDTAIQKGIANFISKQQLAAKQANIQQQQDQAKNLRPVDAVRDHILGNHDAPITLIEYSDFECPFCKRFHPTVEKLLENNIDKVRWVYRHFPLDFHNPGAQQQAEASECVAELEGNDAFWQFSKLLYMRTKSNGKGFAQANLRPLAEEVGVDGEAFGKCLSSGQMTARVKEDISNATSINITGTPAAFLINQSGEVRFVSGALPLERFQLMIDELSK